MNWGQLVSKLDGVRTVIRANKDAKSLARKDDPIVDQLVAIVNELLGAQAPTVIVEDGLLACVPEAAGQEGPASAKQPVVVVDREDGESRMLIMPRETKRISRPPVLEEVLDEKDLGK